MATRYWAWSLGAWVFGLAVLGAGVPAPASAQGSSRGVVVRLETGGEEVSAPVVAVLTPKDGGAAVEVQLNDSGTAPDVNAGDQSWAGAASVDADSVSVVLKAGGKTHDGGAVSWSADDRFRELSIRFDGGAMTMDASVASSTGGDAGGGASGGTSGGASGGAGGTATGLPPLGDNAGGGGTGAAAGGAAGGAPTAGGAAPFGGNTMGSRPSAVSFPSGQSEQGPGLFIGLGVGLLLLVGVAWLWVRTRRSDGPAPSSGLVPLPEPPIVGSHVPSLSDGLSLWVSDEATTAEILRPLLATLAQSHRVLLVGPAALQPPPVHGGPVYRAGGTRPSLVGDAADALLRESGAPLAALFVADVGDANTLRDFADVLPPGVGGVVLSAHDADVPWRKVTVAREGEVFVLGTASGEERVVGRDRGLEVAR